RQAARRGNGGSGRGCRVAYGIIGEIARRVSAGERVAEAGDATDHGFRISGESGKVSHRDQEQRQDKEPPRCLTQFVHDGFVPPGKVLNGLRSAVIAWYCVNRMNTSISKAR